MGVDQAHCDSILFLSQLEREAVGRVLFERELSNSKLTQPQGSRVTSITLIKTFSEDGCGTLLKVRFLFLFFLFLNYLCLSLPD